MEPVNVKMTENKDGEDTETTALWETFTSELDDLKKNVENLIDIKIASVDSEFHRTEADIDKLQSAITELIENIRYTLNPFWQQIKDEMFDLKCLIKERDEEVAKLRASCQQQKSAIENLQSSTKRTKEVLCQQSSYTASLGCTLSGLLWKASKESYTVQSIITGCRFTEFFNTVNDSVKSFFNTYIDRLPHSTSDEVQFIVSLIGVVANVAAVPDGRECVTQTVEGQQMVRQLVQNITKIPDSCICIQRLMLMAIFNVSIHKRGVHLIENDRPLLQLLKRNVSDFHNELKYISLKLLQSITHNLQDRAVLSTVLDEIPFVKLQEVHEKSSDEERNTIAEIRKNLESAILRLQNTNYNAGSTQCNGFQ